MTTPRTDSFEEWLRKWPYDTDLDPEAAWNASRKGAENKIETLTKALEEAESELFHKSYPTANDTLKKVRKALAEIKELK